ncbi:MAG: hypothetical protein H7144_05075 [Burkholderiales bacterium]|nr:hypothetical protein [Phycisphaerae bacterium]
MSDAKVSCAVCADGIPAVGEPPEPCPKCGRRVVEGMVLKTTASGSIVWDYPRRAAGSADSSG